MKHTTHIHFNMEDIDDISNELVNVQNNFYTRPVRVVRNSIHFSIPQQIINNLDLKAKDSCFFYFTIDGNYLSFKQYPTGIAPKFIRERKITLIGNNGTLYLIIPRFFTRLYNKPIKNVKLINAKGMQPHEWQIQFLFTDFT